MTVCMVVRIIVGRVYGSPCGYWKEIEVKVRGEKEGEKGGRVSFLKLGEVLKRTVNQRRCEGLR